MTSKQLAIDLEAILQEIGSFGKFQLRLILLISIPILFNAMYTTQYVFNARIVDYRCLVPQCESSPPEFESNGWGLWAFPDSGGRCEMYRPTGNSCSADSFHYNETQQCNAWVYQHYNSIAAEFNLACSEWKRTLVGTIHNVGLLFALPITGYVSDTFGRRITFILTSVSAGVVGVLRSFSTSYIMYIVLEFLEAVVGAGAYSTGFILAVEMMNLKHRVLGGNIISSTFAVGQVLMALLAWAFPYWRTLTRVIYAPSFLFIFYYFVVEESVRWLLTKGNRKEAVRIILKAAAMNKKELSPQTMKTLSDDTPEISEKTQINTPRLIEERPRELPLALQVLRSKVMVSRVCVCSFWWITVTFIYYGLSINSVSLAGNPYVNFILTSLVEIPGYCLSVITLNRFGRKASIMTAFIICGISLLALPFLPSSMQWLQTSFNMVGKLTISMAFSSIYIYTSELFPTNLRHRLLSICSMVGRIGSIVAPQTPLLVSTLLVNAELVMSQCVIVKSELTMVGKMFISMVFVSIYIYTIELFPTTLRCMLMAFCSMVGRIGSIFAPQTPLLMQYMEALPYLVFGAMAGCSGALMLCTPETLHMRLPDTIAQAENVAVAPRTTRRTDIIVD